MAESQQLGDHFSTNYCFNPIGHLSNAGQAYPQPDAKAQVPDHVASIPMGNR